MKIRVTYSEYITLGEVKAVKAFAKEQKPELENIVRETIRAVEEDLHISFFLDDIKEVEATYYNARQRPVISIAARATDHNVNPREIGHWLFVEAYKSLDEDYCSANIYRRE